MLEKNDLKQIGEVLEQNNKKIRSEFGEVIERNNKKLRSEIREEMGEVLEQNNKKLRLEIREEMGEVIEQNVLPVIDDLREEVNKRFDKVDKRMDSMEAQMVTKDYLDEKLSDMKGDLVVLVRKEDGKLTKLVEILKGKKVLADSDVQEIFKLEPFAKSA